MWIFEGILYVILLLVFIRYDRKKVALDKDGLTGGEVRTLSVRVIGHLRKQKNIEEAVGRSGGVFIRSHFPQNIPMCVSWRNVCSHPGDGDILSMDILSFREICISRGNTRKSPRFCKSKMHGFTGLDVLSVLPVCFLPVVRLWAIQVSEGLSAYYYGSYGMLTTVLCSRNDWNYGLILWLFRRMRNKRPVPAEKVAVTVSMDGIFTGCLCQWHIQKCLKKMNRSNS